MTGESGSIYYFCTGRHAYTIGVFLEYYENGLREILRIIPYEQLPRLGVVPPGTFIFTDLDRLSVGALRDVAALHGSISEQNPDLLLLNDPTRVPKRFELLKRLHAAGMNRFDVYRLGDRASVRRFPVFIRWESRHDAPLTGLLDSAEAVEEAIARLPDSVAGNPDLMIVEFGAVPSADGRFRKYSAFKVGPTLYAQHCFTSTDWYIKYAGTRFSEADRAESRAYAAANPHSGQIERVFDLAEIGYGRIDYGIVDGAVQTFEINGNPIVNTSPPGWEDTSYARYAELHDRALRSLVRPASGPPIRLGTGRGTADEVHARIIRNLRRRIAWRYVKQRLALAIGRARWRRTFTVLRARLPLGRRRP